MENDTEVKAIDTLLERGIFFEVENVGIFRLIKKKVRFNIGQPTLGTLLMLSHIEKNFTLDHSRLNENPINESFKVVVDNVRNVTLFVATAILARRWRVKVFRGMLARYLMWRMKPTDLYSIADILITLSNTGNFCASIRLMQGVRITQPKNLSPENQGG